MKLLWAPSDSDGYDKREPVPLPSEGLVLPRHQSTVVFIDSINSSHCYKRQNLMAVPITTMPLRTRDSVSRLFFIAKSRDYDFI